MNQRTGILGDAISGGQGSHEPETVAAPGGAVESVMISLLVTAHALEERIEKTLAVHGLSFAKLNVLTLMVDAGRPLQLSEVAARLNCVRSNVTQLVDRLEADGLVRREPDPTDRRSIRAVLSAEGKKRQALGSAEYQRILGEFTRSLPESDRHALGRVLALLK